MITIIIIIYAHFSCDILYSSLNLPLPIFYCLSEHKDKSISMSEVQRLSIHFEQMATTDSTRSHEREYDKSNNDN